MDEREVDRRSGEDIRLLGRLLGDVVRSQAGTEAFELVEAVRTDAVATRRGGAPDAGVTSRLLAADVDLQLHVIRAFAWISLLANTAEDVHAERRRRAHRAAGHRQQEGSFAATFNALDDSGAAGHDVATVLRSLAVGHVAHAQARHDELGDLLLSRREQVGHRCRQQCRIVRGVAARLRPRLRHVPDR